MGGVPLPPPSPAPSGPPPTPGASPGVGGLAARGGGTFQRPGLPVPDAAFAGADDVYVLTATAVDVARADLATMLYFETGATDRTRAGFADWESAAAGLNLRRATRREAAGGPILASFLVTVTPEQEARLRSTVAASESIERIRKQAGSARAGDAAPADDKNGKDAAKGKGDGAKGPPEGAMPPAEGEDDAGGAPEAPKPAPAATPANPPPTTPPAHPTTPAESDASKATAVRRVRVLVVQP